MSFKINISGIEVEMNIKGYVPSSENFWESKWCECDYSFRSGSWLNYSKENDEVFMSNEIEALEANLTKLLNDELKETEEIRCIEPDYIFILQPKRDRRKDPSYTYIRPGYEIADIYMEWKIYFWNEGLTDNFLSLRFDRTEITAFRDYLKSVISVAEE